MCLSQSCLSECRPFIVPILYLAPSLPGIGLSSPGAWDLHGMRISSLGGAKVCCMYVSNTRFLPQWQCMSKHNAMHIKMFGGDYLEYSLRKIAPIV